MIFIEVTNPEDKTRCLITVDNMEILEETDGTCVILGKNNGYSGSLRVDESYDDVLRKIEYSQECYYERMGK